VKNPATKTEKIGPSAASQAPASAPVVAPEPQPEAKKPAKTTAKAAAKASAHSTPTASATATPAAAAVQSDTPTVAPTAVKPAAKAAAKTSAKTSAKALEKDEPVMVEPTPRPLGKRAAKKVMMEQMTQAAVVPTHAPDAAKATFSNTNERAVMTPPVPSSIKKDPTRADNWKSLSVEQLTDQDVLAMPDSEYMSDLQLAYFRRKLSKLKADMLANAGETTEHLREDTVVVPDPADRATIEEEHALELRTRDRERKLLKKIEQAIARIDAGDYGYCDETGEIIGVGRLMARPTASLSLEAQQRRELKQKMFGD
jgi:DnaK suppressor protein